MEPFTDSNTPPLSVAQVDWALQDGRKPAPPVSEKAAADLVAMHEMLLAEVTARVGELEAAEWALDQAKAACETEIAAALAAGVPAEKIMAAAGELASSPTEFAEDSEPAAPTADPQPS
ncbi:hypothetical protein [Pseudarthrobacter sp. TAF60_1]|uniref:hypothetical protein n=1 Tax=Pseudarthrobacter sp. TAF60_1 TaxID=3233071 RepID=UPI003F98BDF2